MTQLCATENQERDIYSQKCSCMYQKMNNRLYEMVCNTCLSWKVLWYRSQLRNWPPRQLVSTKTGWVRFVSIYQIAIVVNNFLFRLIEFISKRSISNRRIFICNVYTLLCHDTSAAFQFVSVRNHQWSLLDVQRVVCNDFSDTS